MNCDPIARSDKHLFRYFLDGSARTFYIGNVVEGERQTPVHVAQIGAACVCRNDSGQMKVTDSKHKILLLFNKAQLSFGQQIEDTIAAAGDRYLSVDRHTVAFWDFNKEVDGMIPDISGNGYDAVLVDGTLVPDECHLP